MLHGYLNTLLLGLAGTLAVALGALALACALGLAGALARLSRLPAARGLALAYTTLVRGLPDLVLMLLVFYGGQILVNDLADRQGWPPVDVPPSAAGVLTLGFIYGAYFSETFRGAILAVPAGQLEAARAFGMSRAQVLRRILLPQMARHAIPGAANNWLVLVKATALVSIIGLDDLMQRAGLAASATREPFTFYAAVALLYLAVTTVSIAALSWLERRFSLGVRRVDL